jgi:hypothetical protein
LVAGVLVAVRQTNHTTSTHYGNNASSAQLLLLSEGQAHPLLRTGKFHMAHKKFHSEAIRHSMAAPTAGNFALSSAIIPTLQE